MDISDLIGFTGRINRARWWLWIILMAAIWAPIFFMLVAIFGVGGELTAPIRSVASSRTIAMIQIIGLAVTGYPSTALAVKRLNDRDRPRLLAFVFWAPSVQYILSELLGLPTSLEMYSTEFGMMIETISILLSIWAFIELGILKGTNGPNQHGPDPLAK